MAKYTEKARVNVPMCAACVLLCLVLITTHMMSGLYAKYVSTGSGSDSARVAAFKVVTTGDSNNVVVTSGAVTDNVYTFHIANQSEVAVRYDLSVNDTASIPNGVSYNFDSAAGELPVGGSTTRNLTFAVDWTKFTMNQTGAKAEVTFPFTVTINVVQID